MTYKPEDYQRALEWVDTAEKQDMETEKLLSGFNWSPENYKPDDVFNIIRSAIQHCAKAGVEEEGVIIAACNVVFAGTYVREVSGMTLEGAMAELYKAVDKYKQAKFPPATAPSYSDKGESE